MGLRLGTSGEIYGIAMGLDLWGSMGLRCWTYGAYRGIWDCGVGPMGFLGVYGTAVWDLWGSYGSMGLRFGTYGEIYGDGSGMIWLCCSMTSVLWDLWGLTCLRLGTYGIRIGLWVCGAGPKG